ncbi:MAG TPA: HAMP domain-containing sensor histidine kinase [Acidimicrobiia bacterium]
MPKRLRLPTSLGARLLGAFLIVALGALLLFGVLVLVESSRDVTDLTTQQQAATLTAVAHAAGVAYTDAGGWKNADLDATLTLATDAGARANVLDSHGRIVAGPARQHGRRVKLAPVVHAGTRVGTVRVAFSARSAAVTDLRNALFATIVAGAGLAALLAVIVSITVARRITRPLGDLIRTARKVEAGDWSARVHETGKGGELAELSVAFNRMADSVALHDEMRRTLVADVAHELRTPLTVVRGTLESMIDGVTTTTPARLSSAHDDILRLTRLVEDLETLAAADAAAGPRLKLDDVDLADIAEDAVARFAPQFESADVQLSLHANPARVGGDPRRLHQVTSNLLVNALKFTPAGGAVAVSVDRDHRTARLVVADTGIGIPSEEQGRVFERFWRGASARGVAGSGIGLTVVSELAHAHGGDVRVESQPGHGTRVTVRIPSR